MSYNNIIVISIILLLPHLLQAQDVWQELIADDLKGCTQFGGDVIYFVKENTIIGETIQNTPNSFLTTDAEYGDFIQKYEVYLDTQVNSGVQIRSESNTDYMDGRVHGYQIELDLVAVPGAEVFMMRPTAAGSIRSLIYLVPIVRLLLPRDYIICTTDTAIWSGKNLPIVMNQERYLAGAARCPHGIYLNS